jgi:hypothetical protein
MCFALVGALHQLRRFIAFRPEDCQGALKTSHYGRVQNQPL